MNPGEITDKDIPLIVFSDLTSGLIEFFIKMRTKGDYNHVMLMHRPGYFASQGNTYSEVPISRYMKKNSRLKFYQIVGLTPVQRRFIVESVEKKLKKPFWQKWYDWVGIAGQAVGIKNINIPGLEYCSEDAPHHPKYMASKALEPQSELYRVIMGMPEHASPQGLNEYFKKYPDVFRVFMKWEADDERKTVGMDKGITGPVPA